ncbi:MAG: hypothetical protein RRZ84_00610 [Romboutsia sp.]
MNKINKFIKNKPILASGMMFAILSLIGNIVFIIITGTSHIYDIVHAIPTIFIYEAIIEKMGGIVTTEFIFVPLAVIMDFVIGIVFGAVLNKFNKNKNNYLFGVIIVFLIYWIIVTYQWLPII